VNIDPLRPTTTTSRPAATYEDSGRRADNGWSASPNTKPPSRAV